MLVTEKRSHLTSLVALLNLVILNIFRFRIFAKYLWTIILRYSHYPKIIADLDYQAANAVRGVFRLIVALDKPVLLYVLHSITIEKLLKA